MKNCGFSLVELVITTTIIGLLTAILLPALMSSRGAAERALCASNMRQLYIGLTSYEVDNQTLPLGFYSSFLQFGSGPKLNQLPPGGFKGNLGVDRRGWWWFDFLQQNSSTSNGLEDLLYCPSGKITASAMLRGNYGVNQSICREFNSIIRSEFTSNLSLSSMQIRNPARVLFLTDSGNSLINWKIVADNSPNLTGHERSSYLPGLKINANKSIMDEFRDDALAGRHTNNTVNVIYMDGHIKALPAEELAVTKTGNGYANRFPLWSPKQ